MKFTPFIELRLEHEYYTDRRCPDFEIEPALATKKLLRNHRCVLKPIPSGVCVYISVSTDGTPLIPLSRDAILTFHLRLHNPDFALFTDLTNIMPFAAPLFTNIGAKTAARTRLLPGSRSDKRSDYFVIQQPGAGESFTLHSRPIKDLTAAHFSISGLGAMSSPPSYDEDARSITINSQEVQTGDSFSVSYPTQPRLGKGVWADIDLHVNNILPDLAKGSAGFQILFLAKSAKWTYYVVVDKAKHRVHIEDKDTTPILFADEHRTDLNQHPDASDDIAMMLATQFPEMQRLRFVSKDLVPCRQAARKSIQLVLDDKPVLRTLPNPSLRNSTTKYVTNGGDVVREDSFYQVVKYISYQFQATGG